jgi:hypothetical protein
MFAKWKADPAEPGLSVDRIQMSRFLGGGKSCTPQSRLGGNTEGQLLARRPFLGLTRKDRTVCRLWVEGPSGNEVLGAPDVSTPYTSFFAQDISEQRMEKAQIVETFGDPKVFFFGERPRVYAIRGVLLNADNFDWRNRWWDVYENYLRGTQCVRKKAVVRLAWDDIITSGYIMGASAAESAHDPLKVAFQFTFLVTDYQLTQYAQDNQYYYYGDDEYVDVPGGISYTKTSAFELSPDEALYSGVKDYSTKRWIVMSPALRAWMNAGGTNKLKKVLGDLGVDTGGGAGRALDVLANPGKAGVAEAESAIGTKYTTLAKSSRMLAGVVGAGDDVSRRLGSDRKNKPSFLDKVSHELSCLNSSWSSLMYGMGEIVSAPIETAALTTTGVQKVMGGDETIGEGIDDFGKVLHSVERVPGTVDQVEAIQAEDRASGGGAASPGWELDD